MDFKNLSITEIYTLCILKNREDTFKNNDLIAHLIVSIIIEMSQNKNLEIISKNKIKLLDNTPQNPYMMLLYSILKEMNLDRLDLTTCISKLCIDYNKKIMPIIECIKNNLLNQKIIQIQEEKKLFIKKEITTITDNIFQSILLQLQTKFSNELEVDNTVLLLTLLTSTKILKNSFLDKNQKEIENKLSTITKDNLRIKIDTIKSIIFEIENQFCIVI